ncbi:MAG: dethiobiotin synthase [Limnobacter sp.]|nr:dethiobiotin synthase [Limnobacter sp.]
MSSSVFITGTDTEIGKTLVSKWICLHWKADYWKPVQSGLQAQTDSQKVAEETTIQVHPETYRLTRPLSPHESARLDGITLELLAFKKPSAEKLVIEGAGGLLVPLNQSTLMVDLIAWLQVPCLLVASSQLGTINHTLLSLQALAARGLSCLGVVLSGPANEANRRAIEHYGNTPVLAELPQLESTTTESLKSVPLPDALLQALNSPERRRV